MSQIDRSRPIPDTVIFDGRQSRRGYGLNRFCLTLTRPENRAAMKEDANGYMAECGLTKADRDLVHNRDYLGVIEAGGNIYLIMKVGGVNGDGLYQMGAQPRGQTEPANRRGRAEVARIIGGIGTSHVRTIGVVHDQGRHGEPAWKPLFAAYEPVLTWLADRAPDVAIVV